MGRATDSGSRRVAMSGALLQFKSKVLAIVAAIPEGRVTTYGALARHLQVTPRRVAFILATLTAQESQNLPWFRVVAAGGVVSSTKLGAVGRKQITRLRAEGISVTPQNKVEDFARIVWGPP
jgi:methylated-DNA-protein-cysteine methyltransferase-like protein